MSQSENTKQKLIDSAIKIFAEKGFWKAKVSDIVNHAGVAQGTFYIYFKSKDDCLKKILLILHNETINKIYKMLEQDKTLSDIILFFIERVMKFKEITKVFLFEAISSGKEFKELYFDFKKNFKEIFERFLNDPILISIIIGSIHEVIEQDILYENIKKEKVLTKIKKILKKLNIEGS